MNDQTVGWWGSYFLEEDQAIYWSINERQIVVQRKQAEWITWNVEATEPEPFSNFNQGNWTGSGFPDSKTSRRHLFTNTEGDLDVLPALANRSVTSRPNVPLQILAGEKARLFVSSPLWLQMKTQKKSVCFFDEPLWRPSDSWFGPSSIVGELCYAKYTDARVELEALERRVYRAITPVEVINNGEEPLVIERFNLPVPMLSLFSDASGTLWTQTLVVKRELDDSETEITIDKRAPAEAGSAILISQPRIAVSRGRLIRSLSSLFA